MAPGGVVRQYRLYFFNGPGRFTHVHEYLAETDDRAIRIAEAWREGRGMELWQQERRVQRWDCD